MEGNYLQLSVGEAGGQLALWPLDFVLWGLCIPTHLPEKANGWGTELIQIHTVRDVARIRSPATSAQAT